MTYDELGSYLFADEYLIGDPEPGYYEAIEFRPGVDHAPVEITSFVDDRTGTQLFDIWSDGMDIAIETSLHAARETAMLFIANYQ